jgi:hypothetical protein
VRVIGSVAARNKAREFAIGIVQLDCVLTPMVLRPGSSGDWSETQVRGNRSRAIRFRRLTESMACRRIPG